MGFWKHLPIIILILGSLIDLITTTIVYLVSLTNPLKPFPEINPLYRLIPNFWVFISINIFLVAWLVYWYYNAINNKRIGLVTLYIIFTIILITGLGRGLIGTNNTNYIRAPPMETIEQAQELTDYVQKQGTTNYIQIMAITIITPIILLIINFILFQKAFKLKREDPK